MARPGAGGWLPEAAIRYVSEFLGMAHIRVLEVATFYTMFNLQPVGKFHVQLCSTTPCWLRGADDLEKICRKRFGEQFDVTADGKFSWIEVECLGACVNAPMVQINYDFYEDLTAESFNKILDDLAAGKNAKAGTADRPAAVGAGRRADHAHRQIALPLEMRSDECSPTRTASSPISTACTIGASKARARAAPGTAPRRSSSAAATRSSTR